MPFNPSTLPSTVHTAYKHGPKFWRLAVSRALKAAMFDITSLTDMIFCVHPPTVLEIRSSRLKRS